MKPLLFVALAAAVLAGCANQAPAPVSLHNDWRTGTDYSPYRSIPTVLHCDDCRL